MYRSVLTAYPIRSISLVIREMCMKRPVMSLLKHSASNSDFMQNCSNPGAYFSHAPSTFVLELISSIFGSVADTCAVQVTFHDANH